MKNVRKLWPELRNLPVISNMQSIRFFAIDIPIYYFSVACRVTLRPLKFAGRGFLRAPAWSAGSQG